MSTCDLLIQLSNREAGKRDNFLSIFINFNKKPLSSRMKEKQLERTSVVEWHAWPTARPLGESWKNCQLTIANCQLPTIARNDAKTFQLNKTVSWGSKKKGTNNQKGQKGEKCCSNGSHKPVSGLADHRYSRSNPCQGQRVRTATDTTQYAIVIEHGHYFATISSIFWT